MPASFIKAFSEAFKTDCYKKFHDWEGDVKDHGDNDDGADGNVPIGSDVFELSLEEKVEFICMKFIIIVLKIDNNNDQSHIHNE